MTRLTIGLALTALLCAAPVAAAGDPAKGKAVFARCAICHSLEPGQNKLGPSLAGVFGRTAGTLPGFAYSPAMAKSGIVWSETTIDTFIKAPRAVVPGTKMAFAGLPAAPDRANVIAYLATTKAKAK